VPPDRDRLDLLLALTDLTSLELTDTPESIAGLCARALRPDPEDPSCPPVAAVCVYPQLVKVAAAELAGSGIAVASVVGNFPSGVAAAAAKAAEAEQAVADGATELDLIVDHVAFTAGDTQRLTDDVAAVRAVSPGIRLKVILETGALAGPVPVRLAADLALEAGADMLKTSTGKGHPGAAPAAAAVLLDAVAEFAVRRGRQPGVKVSGGVRTPETAMAYLAQAESMLPTPLTPATFRIGASTLVTALVEQRRLLS
jgi:deoxyribose-phosphate aldolase